MLLSHCDQLIRSKQELENFQKKKTCIQKIKKLLFYIDTLAELGSRDRQSQLTLSSKFRVQQELRLFQKIQSELADFKEENSPDPKLLAILSKRINQFRRSHNLKTETSLKKMELPKYRIDGVNEVGLKWATRNWISSNKAYRKVVLRKWKELGADLLQNHDGSSVIKSHIWSVFEKIVGAEVLTGQDLSEQGDSFLLVLYIAFGLIHCGAL